MPKRYTEKPKRNHFGHMYQNRRENKMKIKEHSKKMERSVIKLNRKKVKYSLEVMGESEMFIDK